MCTHHVHSVAQSTITEKGLEIDILTFMAFLKVGYRCERETFHPAVLMVATQERAPPDQAKNFANLENCCFIASRNFATE